jgi:cbb3-type cytochrome oxidase subunit 3
MTCAPPPPSPRYGDVTPQTAWETLVNMGVFIVGVVFFAVFIGSIGSMLSRATKSARRAQLFREKMEAIDNWLHARRHLAPRLKKKIRLYYADVRISPFVPARGLEEAAVTRQLCLRMNVCVCVCVYVRACVRVRARARVCVCVCARACARVRACEAQRHVPMVDGQIRSCKSWGEVLLGMVLDEEAGLE